MMSPTTREAVPTNSPHWGLMIPGVVGVVSVPFAWWGLQSFQINVIKYELERVEAPAVPLVTCFSILAFAFPLLLAAIASRRIGLARSLALLSPLSLAAPLAISLIVAPDASFYFLLLAIVATAAAAFTVGRAINWNSARHPALAILTLFAFVAIATFLHTRIQLNFYNHFMFGHADIGHFTEELKNALVGRGLRSDSFDNTRLGWHFVPLMYILVPGYWLWPSITYLMTLGPLVLHLAAFPVFWFARRITDSVLVAFLAALAWLLLPSISRLVYSNTYGFAWLYTSLPILGFLLGAMLLGRWKLFWLLIVILLLSRETHTAITLGVGIYIALFTPGRRTGLALICVSIAYGLLCATVIIPYFAAAGRYERLDIFGELGGSLTGLAMSPFTNPGIFFGRLFREQSISFLLILLASMCFLPLRSWRLALAAVPALLVHLLMANSDWLSIKFWHHAMVIPIFFFAALCAFRRPTFSVSAAAEISVESPASIAASAANRAATVRERGDDHTPPLPLGEGRSEGQSLPSPLGEGRGEGQSLPLPLGAESDREGSSKGVRATPPLPLGEGRGEGYDSVRANPHHHNLGLALALLTAAAMSHYLFGFSPLSKSYELYAADPFLQSPDPRLAFIAQLRREIPRDRTILATERVAAHFTDYRRLYTGRRIRPADFVILDQSDRWDTSGLPARAAEFAANPDYQLHAQSGPIVVYVRTNPASLDGPDESRK